MSGHLRSADVALAILAGGQGVRMGGSKHRLRVRDRPMLDFLVEHLQWPGPKVLVLRDGSELPPAHERCDRILRDKVPDQGPLRGMLTGLEDAAAPAVLFIPIDMPWLERAHLEYLVAELARRPRAAGAMLQRYLSGEPRTEPFPSIFRGAAAPLIREQLERGDLAVRSLASSVAILEAPPWPADAWRNLNTPGDLPDWISFD